MFLSRTVSGGGRLTHISHGDHLHEHGIGGEHGQPCVVLRHLSVGCGFEGRALGFRTRAAGRARTPPSRSILAPVDRGSREEKPFLTLENEVRLLFSGLRNTTHVRGRFGRLRGLLIELRKSVMQLNRVQSLCEQGMRSLAHTTTVSRSRVRGSTGAAGGGLYVLAQYD